LCPRAFEEAAALRGRLDLHRAPVGFVLRAWRSCCWTPARTSTARARAGFTALDTAVQNGDEELARLLLARGADPGHTT